ncbi:PIR Superfamily Protein [Plasmodium ovale wallikeri]|uniref:PIR Superfamily Protein n=2 Tax=Plasmodium ovale TaxID=36330 RepID=A0A1A9APR7_PLAOA|nr:PIR Superfamily Protein [Plasmodium ovale wallikeri]SBT58210.1 PIR Superfamily Protein [Plasmodium ovale wallikeri]SBT73587.1 PIR protein [Plasmodium ovale]
MGLESEEEEDEQEHNYAYGENYYSSVNSFLKYEDEFNRITNEGIHSNEHGVECNKIGIGLFSSNDFSDPCNKVAKYLYYIDKKKDEDYDNRCRCLNYLLNTKATFKTVSSKKGPELFGAYKEISNKLNTCHLIIDCIYEADLQKITKLFSLHNSLGKLQKSIENEDENIYRTAEEFAQHYSNAIIDCKSGNTDGYCVALKEFEAFCAYHTKSENCAEIAELIKYQQALKKSVKIVVPCIMLLGIPFFLYILHKFTSFGSWFNTFLIKNKIIQHDMNKGTTENFFEYTHGNKESGSKYSLHHIGYHAI